MGRPYERIRVLGVLALAMATGCERQLMPAPNLWALTDENPWAGLSPELQTTTVDLLYVTDRQPIERADGTIRYGYGRSWSQAVGSVEVELGRNKSWDELVAASRTNKRKSSWPIAVTAINEMIRLPTAPIALIKVDGEVVPDAGLEETRRVMTEEFKDEIRRRLALTPEKSVGVLVHGYHNTFDDAALTLAEYWHMCGRQGVALLYTWPAGAPGTLRGYTRDRESGQFTVYHLTRVIEALASIPEVSHLELIAHSRGTDVLFSAVKDLVLRARGAGRDPNEIYRVQELVLAAPDMDFEVLVQRFATIHVGQIADKITVYVSKNDKAVSLSEWLHASDTRIGRLQPEKLDPYARAFLAMRADDVAIVDARVKTGSSGHSYYHSSPAVSSDMLLFLMGEQPGTPQRPLVEVFPGYWILDDERYPFVESEDGSTR